MIADLTYDAGITDHLSLKNRQPKEMLGEALSPEGMKEPLQTIPENSITPDLPVEGFMGSGPSIEIACENFYYNGSGYFMREGDLFIPLTEGRVSKHLKKRGLSTKDVDLAICHITAKHFVEWVGPMAGHRTGIHTDEDSGRQFLVTRPPQIIESSPGDWELVRRIVRGLFMTETYPDQFQVVMGWVKQARENVKRGVRRPIPALAMVGPINSGKTLFLEIIRLALGGRSAPAFRALTNENGFNADILGAELLTVDDQMAPRDKGARVRFGQAIKSQLFASTLRVEEKHQNAFSTRPVHALALALNDEPQHVQVLPEMDPSLSDKITLIKTGRADFLPGETDDRERLMAQIKAEIPSFLHWLEQLEIPEHLCHPRTGIAAWHHPSVLAMLQEISPENRLLELINQCETFSPHLNVPGNPWRGTAAEMEGVLMEDPVTRSATKTLTSWNGAIGTYLRRLIAKASPIIRDGGQRQGIQTWVIGNNEL